MDSRPFSAIFEAMQENEVKFLDINIDQMETKLQKLGAVRLRPYRVVLRRNNIKASSTRWSL